MTTLKEAINVMKSLETLAPGRKINIANELLGKYEGIIPKGKSSSKFIRDIRDSLYGKSK